MEPTAAAVRGAVGRGGTEARPGPGHGSGPGPGPAEAHGAGPCATVDAGMTRVFGLLGKRWTGLIIAVLLDGPVHFSDLRRAIPGISERMLSDRLSELSAEGLVLREVVEGPPLRVAYRLTETGAALKPALAALGLWAETYLPEKAQACRERIAPRATGGSRGAGPVTEG
ncbi:transcriptional regulator [Streptomyces sp. SID4919]|nr:transcriptional regulator [Streptomyces sp. SID4919]